MKHFLNRNSLVVILTFILALSLRFYGLNWDQGQHLHPDERFLTMVDNDIKLPNSISEYFNTSVSPLNPYNYSNYKFFVYGTLPLFLVKFLSVILHLDNYESIVLVGRACSAIFDSFNIILLFYISRKLFSKNSKLIFLPGLTYAFCVLPIQLSHFFTVDTFLSTFLLATFTLLTYNLFILAALAFGLAIACKISAIYFTPIIFLFIISKIFEKKNIFYILQILFFGFLATFVALRIFQPYAFIGIIKINPQFIESIKTLMTYSKPDGYYPPGVQWMSIGNPLLFTLKNIVIWGFGLPLSFGILILLKSNFKKLSNRYILIIVAWILLLFLYQGSQFTPTMRYFIPIYPFLTLLFAYLFKKSKVIYFLLALHFVYGFLFLNIYSRDHTRVEASNWIYGNVPVGSTITNEYWDDPLPLNVNPHNAGIYNGVMISPYDPDSPEKINKLTAQINSASYVFMSSNRLWRSIPSVPSFYPLTSKFYNDLFMEKLNFVKVLEINSYPGISLPFLSECYYFGPTNFPGIANNWFSVDQSCPSPGIYLRDDTAEEAFTVYDHPKVLIYEKR